METLGSFWARDPCDLGQSRHESLWDSQCVENSPAPVSCVMWTEMSPHLQRNKQLHDTLLQREEELARLQEENNKLRQFLNSSFVRDLEEKAKQKLCVSGRRKRILTSSTDPISKRVCRNLTAEFCSESETSEPNLDLWVLRTLGLKDKDTIDTTLDDTATSCNQSVYDSGTDYCSPITAHRPQTNYCPIKHYNPKDGGFGNSSICTDFSTPEVYNSITNVQAIPEHTYFTGQSPNMSFTVEQNKATHWSASLQATLSHSPSKRLHFSPVSCSTPNKAWTQQDGGDVSGSSRTRPDLAFSMSLSPSFSVKTHSFPQGQAFVRRDPQGRCNFTWVPKDRP